MAAGDVSVSINSQAIRNTPFSDGVVSGGVTISDGAMVFDGVNGKVTTTLTDNSPFNTGFTISFWASISDKNKGGIIFQKATGNFAANGFRISHDAVNKRMVIDINNTLVRTTATNSILDENVFKHYLVTVQNNGTVTWYINNVQNGTIGATGTPSTITTASALIMGARNDNNIDNFFKGNLTNAFVINRVLSSSEITQIYNAGKDAYSPVTDGLVAQYSGRDYTGTAAAPKRIQDTATFNRSTLKTFQREMETLRKNTNANGKFLFDEVNNQIILAHIEEA